MKTNNNMNLKDRKFIVAYKFLKPQESTVLSRDINESLEEAFSKIDVNPFVGQGIAIYGCHLIDSVDNAEDIPFEIPVDGKLTAFEVETIFEGFTLIEGTVSPGIYRFKEHDWDYYEIKDAVALTRFFDQAADFDYENLKFVCCADGISLQAVKDGEEFYFFERHPLSYFDIYCPLCRQKVLTYKTLNDFYTCEIVAVHCPHFVGNAVKSSSGYDTQELNDLKINYKFDGEEIYFETSKGWEKPLIFAPPHDPVNSIWDGLISRGNDADHFFFVKSKPTFQVE